MPERLDAAVMALRVAREFFDGAVVNLGLGLPLRCSDYVPPDREVLFHSEQGLVGFGQLVTEPTQVDLALINAGGLPVAPRPGMVFMSHDESFAMIRGGHIDITVLGALQVSAYGDLANTRRPGRIVGNIGGAQDLATCARRVIVLMHHTTEAGDHKIVPECTLMLTARQCVDLIVTDIAVLELSDGSAILREYAPGWSVGDIQALTGVPLAVSDSLCEFSLI